MFHNAKTMTFCLIQLSQLQRTLLRSRNHHFLAPQKLLTKEIRKRYMCSKNERVNQEESDEFYEESPYVNIDFTTIAGNNPDEIRKLKKIQLEIDMLRQQGEKVPTAVTTEQWMDILQLETQHARTQFYSFLWLNELKNQRKKEKQARNREEFLQKKATLPSYIEVTTRGPVVYGLSHNTLFFRICDTRINQFYNLKLFSASMYGSHIVVDCSYEPFMTQRNMNLCAKQMLLMWSENREHCDPSHLVFCNMGSNSELYSKLSRTLFPKGENDFPFFTSSKSYLDLYPKKNLVYLTPHCNEELREYSPNDIYILGAFVDKNHSEPLSLAKAKKEGLRMAKFPLDKYLRWQMGTKSLTLNQCLGIMNDLRTTRDWSYALQNVPSRKIQRRESNVEDENEEYLENVSTHTSARLIREQYRRNLVYDLLMKDASKNKKKPTKKDE